jgi:hypothetical protein
MEIFFPSRDVRVQDRREVARLGQEKNVTVGYFQELNAKHWNKNEERYLG